MLRQLLRLLPSLTVSLSVASLMVSPSQAQKNPADLTANLLDEADCVTTRSTSEYYTRLYTRERDDLGPVSINRRVFDRLFSLGSHKDGNSIALSCRVNPDEYGIVDLEMGVTDSSAQYGVSLTVDVYQGGSLRHTYSDLQAGSLVNVVLDLNDPEIPSEPNNFTVEMTCYTGSGNHCYLQFLEARLYPAGPVTSFPSSSIDVPTLTPSPSSTTGPSSTPPPPTSTVETPPEPSSSRQDAPAPGSSRQDAPSSRTGNIFDSIERIIDIFR